MLRKLPPEELTAIKSEFSHAQPLENLILRLERLYGSESLRWGVQDNYRAWSGDDIVMYGGAVMVAQRTRARRLFLWRTVNSNGKEELIPLATVTLHRREHGSLGPHPHNVGRTFIFNPEEFVAAPDDVSVYLMGANYEVFVPALTVGRLRCRTFPFAQQDSEFHRCLDVSVWLKLDFMSRQVGSARVPIGLIRTSDARSRHHTAPVDGLLPDDALAAVTAAGLAGLYYVRDDLPPPTEPEGIDGSPPTQVDERCLRRLITHYARELGFPSFLDTMHIYIDSQIPVVGIIGRYGRVYDGEKLIGFDPVGLHSICIVGHTSAPHAHTRTLLEAEYDRCDHSPSGISTTCLVGDFIGQDDDVGPFQKLRARRTVGGADPRDGEDLSRLWWESVEGNVVAFIVGLPPQVRMSAEDAGQLCRGVLRSPTLRDEYAWALKEAFLEETFLNSPEGKRWHEGRTNEPGRSLVESVSEDWASGRLVMSIYLEHSSRLRESAVSTENEISDDLREFYLVLPLPKYVWVAELMTFESAARDPTDARVIGEIVIDSTCPLNWSPVLSFRLPGVIFNNPLSATTASVDPGTFDLRQQWTVMNARHSAGNGRGRTREGRT